MRLARIGFDRVVGAVGDVQRVLAEHPELAVASLRLSASDFAGWNVAADAGRPAAAGRRPQPRRAGGWGHPRCGPPSRWPRCSAGSASSTRGHATVVYCAGGYRSSIAASVLAARGFAQVADILGGYDAWHAAGFPTETAATSRS